MQLVNTSNTLMVFSSIYICNLGACFELVDFSAILESPEPTRVESPTVESVEQTTDHSVVTKDKSDGSRPFIASVTSLISYKKEVKSRGRNPKPQTLFFCDICQKPFSFQSLLDRHKAKHSNEKPFVCVECGCRFKYQGSLNNHACK